MVNKYLVTFTIQYCIIVLYTIADGLLIYAMVEAFKGKATN